MVVYTRLRKMQAFFNIFSKKSFNFFFGLLTGKGGLLIWERFTSVQMLASPAARMVKR